MEIMRHATARTREVQILSVVAELCSYVVEETMSAMVKLAKEVDEPYDISQPRKLVTRRDKLRPRSWSKRHQGACLDVEDEAFQEKDGNMDEPRSVKGRRRRHQSACHDVAH